MNVAIVVAAGKGTRLGRDRGKQFIELGGVPIIVRAIQQFELSKEIDDVIAVLPADETAGFESVVQRFALGKVTRVVAGGATRAQSVRNGLNEISEAEIVAVHDGVRPFVTPDEIDATVSAARVSGAAILTVLVADTIKAVRNDRVVRTLPRRMLRRALTPQCFRFDILRRAYDHLAEVPESIVLTDDSQLVERLGVKVVTVEGSARNIKITNEEDLVFAEAILKSVVSCP